MSVNNAKALCTFLPTESHTKALPTSTCYKLVCIVTHLLLELAVSAPLGSIFTCENIIKAYRVQIDDSCHHHAHSSICISAYCAQAVQMCITVFIVDGIASFFLLSPFFLREQLYGM